MSLCLSFNTALSREEVVEGFFAGSINELLLESAWQGYEIVWYIIPLPYGEHSAGLVLFS
ncbi:hypothetical protein GZ78_22070 [Endozoicomonas numazuensis]|uniref:Uncharacterized protein n=1 Tax=Endozoicomonas numazuensis TaxID=1137799 RepID=A0A081NDK9_9GAMM|nr:hypothetical protein GZ78_22070 [Endozoicomonas numazuensis]